MSNITMKFARIKKEDGSYSSLIPIGADAQNVDLRDGRNLENVLQNVVDLNNFASTFDESKGYNEGDCVFKDGVLYRFKVEHSAGNGWNQNQVEQTQMSEYLNSSFDPETIATPFSSSLRYEKGDYVFKNGILYRFLQDHIVGTEWNDGQVEATFVGKELKGTHLIKIDENHGLVLF